MKNINSLKTWVMKLNILPSSVSISIEVKNVIVGSVAFKINDFKKSLNFFLLYVCECVWVCVLNLNVSNKQCQAVFNDWNTFLLESSYEIKTQSFSFTIWSTGAQKLYYESFALELNNFFVLIKWMIK